MIWDWNEIEWNGLFERGDCALNFDPHDGYVRKSTREVMVDLLKWTSDEIDGWIWTRCSALQCSDAFWTIFGRSKWSLFGRCYGTS